MYPKHLYALVALFIVLFASCKTTHTVSAVAPVPHPGPVVGDNTNNTSASNKTINTSASNKTVIHNNDSSVATKKTTPKIIEKGGKFIMIPPAYMRLKPEVGAETCNALALAQKITTVKKYAASHGYNDQLAFFIDMHVKSNHNRFFVINLRTGNIVKQGLVAHGRGNEKFTFNHSYSNGAGSNCTSLGMYKIGKGYNGAFGLSYKLFGLEKTNSNALKRYVVLHAMGAIPEAESKYPIIQSEGCPAVSPAFLSGLAPLIDHAAKNILLCIYDSSK